MNEPASLDEFVRAVFSGLTAVDATDSDRAQLLMEQATDEELVRISSLLPRHKLGVPRMPRSAKRYRWWMDTCSEGELWNQLRRQGDPVEIMSLSAMIAVKRLLKQRGSQQRRHTNDPPENTC